MTRLLPVAIFMLALMGAPRPAAAALAESPGSVAAEKVRLFQQARRAEQRREFSQASGLYTRLLRIAPDSAEIWTNHGLVLYELNQHRQALDAFRRAAALNSRLLTPHLFTGIVHLKLGEPDAALAPLRAALALHPGHPQATYELAHALVLKHEFASAIELYQGLLSRRPDLEQARYRMGLAYLKWSEAATRNLAASPAPPPYGKILLAQLQAVAGMPAEAEANLRAAVQALPGAAEPLLALARFLTDFRAPERLQEAQDLLARGGNLASAGSNENQAVQAAKAAATAEDYEHALRLLLAGDSKDNGGETIYWVTLTCRALAREAFREAIRRDPGSYRAHLLLADMARNKGDTAGAMAEYQEAATLGVNDPEVHLLYIQFLASVERDDEARRRAEAAVERFPSHASLNYELGRLLLKAGSPRPAAGCFRRALEAEPGMAAARAGLADSHAALGEFDSAIREMKRAAGSDPDGSFHYRLGRWLQKTGDHKSAGEAFATSSRLKDERREKERARFAELAATHRRAATPEEDR